jgi:hypothetical protein
MRAATPTVSPGLNLQQTKAWKKAGRSFKKVFDR